VGLLTFGNDFVWKIEYPLIMDKLYLTGGTPAHWTEFKAGLDLAASTKDSPSTFKTTPKCMVTITTRVLGVYIFAYAGSKA